MFFSREFLARVKAFINGWWILVKFPLSNCGANQMVPQAGRLRHQVQRLLGPPKIVDFPTDLILVEVSVGGWGKSSLLPVGESVLEHPGEFLLTGRSGGKLGDAVLRQRAFDQGRDIA